MKTAHGCLPTIRFLVLRAEITVPAGRIPWLHTSSIADFPIVYIGAHLDNNASTFVAWRPNPKLGHWRGSEIANHKMKIRVADSGDVQLDEDFIWS
jgi:hypothetical protein